MNRTTEKSRLNFTMQEYAARLTKTQKAMAAAELDTLVVVDPSNMHWLTGYDGWSFYVHQCVIVPQSGDPVWFGRGIDANGARFRSWLGENNIVDYPDHYVMSTERHAMEFLAGVMATRGLDKGVIGVEMDNYYYSAAAHASLVNNLPDAQLKDCRSLGQLAAGSEITTGTRLHAQGRQDCRGHACTHSPDRSSGPAKK